jgi:polyhydroxybutyrate depolymerase
LRIDTYFWYNMAMKILLHITLAAAFLSGCLPYLYTPAGTQVVTTRTDGQQREYLLYVPASYSPESPAPLVITIHGFSQWPGHQAWLSRWNQLAEEKGVIVAYPSGTGFPKRWAMGGSNGMTFDSAPDVAFLRRMIGEIASQYRIDATRIYVNGLSNGGGMTYILACELADHIAAVGVVAGGIIEPVEGCHPSRPVPVIAFHGSADKIVPYAGGKFPLAPYPFPRIEDWAAGWGDRNGCAPAPMTATTGAVHSSRYVDCAGGSEVILYTVDGAGHTWPGGEALPVFIAGQTTQEIDATRLMWDFFAAHARQPAVAKFSTRAASKEPSR